VAIGIPVALLLGLTAFAALLFHDLRTVRTDVASARDTLQNAIDSPASLRTAQGRAATRAQVDSAVQSVAAGRRRADHSLALSLVGVVPGLRGQRAGLLGLLDDAGAAASSGRDLLAKVDLIAERTPLRDGSVPLDGLRELAGDVQATATTLGGLARPSSRLWGPLGDARRRFDELARSSSGRLREGADALEAARAFMGADGNRRYLVALENNSEMRDQGAILSFVVLRFEGGRLAFDRNGSVQLLRLDRPAPTAVPPGTAEVFGSIQPTQLWQSVNATADFAWSGRAMSDMYLHAAGQPIDGVIAIDVPGLAALLRVVGPVQVADIAEPVTADNVGRIVLHDVYQGLTPGTDPLRRERLGELTRAVIDRLTSGSHDAVALGRELGNGAGGGHLRLWSRVPDEEGVFERTGLGGGPATVGADRTFHLAVENRTATKLDYYVKPSVRQDVQLSPQGTAVVRTTVVVDNQAPTGQAPSYQLGPDGTTTTNPGDYLSWLLLWGPAGSMQAGGVDESGLVVSQRVVPVAAGQRREISFETVIPHAVRDGRLRLRLVPQARLVPVDLEVRLHAPGWHVGGPASWKGRWDRVLGLDWRVSR
jgi:hypothetical protein